MKKVRRIFTMNDFSRIEIDPERVPLNQSRDRSPSLNSSSSTNSYTSSNTRTYGSILPTSFRYFLKTLRRSVSSQVRNSNGKKWKKKKLKLRTDLRFLCFYWKWLNFCFFHLSWTIKQYSLNVVAFLFTSICLRDTFDLLFNTIIALSFCHVYNSTSNRCT